MVSVMDVKIQLSSPSGVRRSVSVPGIASSWWAVSGGSSGECREKCRSAMVMGVVRQQVNRSAGSDGCSGGDWLAEVADSTMRSVADGYSGRGVRGGGEAAVGGGDGELLMDDRMLSARGLCSASGLFLLPLFVDLFATAFALALDLSPLLLHPLSLRHPPRHLLHYRPATTPPPPPPLPASHSSPAPPALPPASTACTRG